MEGLEAISFQIIAAVGAARSSYIKAIDLASEGKFEEAKELIEEGQKHFNEGHKVHGELLTMMANDELPAMNLLLTHAEDQMMSAEAFGIIAERFIKLYKKLEEK